MHSLSFSQRCALILDLARKLRDRGSWCGETHIQKAMYIFQDLAGANLGYKFIMYKHGPFSFDLKEELVGMRASNLIELTFRQKEYGPSILSTPFGEHLREVHMENIEKFDKVSDFVADWLAKSDVRQLEKIATAYFVTKKNPRDPATARAKRVSDLKPHVKFDDAEEAIRVVDQKREEARSGLAA